MAHWVPLVVSSAAGALVTLLGAITGGVIAGRSQRRYWIRDRQVDACAAIVAESTSAELAMRRLWGRHEKVDWKTVEPGAGSGFSCRRSRSNRGR